MFGSFRYAALSGKVGQDKYIPKFNQLYFVNFFVQYYLVQNHKKIKVPYFKILVLYLLTTLIGPEGFLFELIGKDSRASWVKSGVDWNNRNGCTLGLMFLLQSSEVLISYSAEIMEAVWLRNCSVLVEGKGKAKPKSLIVLDSFLDRLSRCPIEVDGADASAEGLISVFSRTTRDRLRPSWHTLTGTKSVPRSNWKGFCLKVLSYGKENLA